jgi:hypothetical protein
MGSARQTLLHLQVSSGAKVHLLASDHC